MLVTLWQHQHDSIGVMLSSKIGRCRRRVEINADRARDQDRGALGVVPQRGGGDDVIEPATNLDRLDGFERDETDP